MEPQRIKSIQKNGADIGGRYDEQRDFSHIYPQIPIVPMDNYVRSCIALAHIDHLIRWLVAISATKSYALAASIVYDLRYYPGAC